MHDLLSAAAIRLVLAVLILTAALPVILVIACFGKGSYLAKVRRHCIALLDVLLWF